MSLWLSVVFEAVLLLTSAAVSLGCSLCAAQVEPIEALVRLESSTKWPDEVDAVRSTGTAFLIRLAQCLEKKVRQNRSRKLVGNVFGAVSIWVLHLRTCPMVRTRGHLPDCEEHCPMSLVCHLKNVEGTHEEL